MTYKIVEEDNLLKISSDSDNNPYWELNFWTSKFTYDLHKTTQFLLDKEEYILEKYEPKADGGTNLGPETTTARYSVYNLFDEFDNTNLQEIKAFVCTEYIKFLDKLEVTVQNPRMTAWYNILHYGQHIDRHLHGDLSRMSANMVISSYDSSTFYELPYNCGVYERKNKDGELVIFNSMIPHWTSINKVHKPRITLATDFYDDKMFSNELLEVMTFFK